MSKAHDPLAREVLSRAAEVLGSRARLAERLGVSLSQLEQWLRNETPPPPKVVFAALAIVEGKAKL